MTAPGDTEGESTPLSATDSRPILLFDGICNLCHASVRFVVRHERAPTLWFCALQSRAGAALLARFGLEPACMDSLMLLEAGQFFTHAGAALRVAGHLRAPWRWLRVLRVFPRPLQRWLYEQVARRRYRWFGRREEVCLLPAPELRARIIE